MREMRFSYSKALPRTGTAALPLREAGECMAKDTVYRFTWWDNHARKEVVSPRFATLEAITRCNGKHIEDTRLVVDARAVDRNGFYSIPIA
jgi:hypothetical protein